MLVLVVDLDAAAGPEAAEGRDERPARAEGIDKVMNENKLDALVAPTTGPAWLIDFIKGAVTP